MQRFDKSKADLNAMAEADKARILAWRNSDRVRRHMITTHRIGSAEHDAWFARALSDPHQRHFIFHYDCRPLGLVSFSDISEEGKSAMWGFYIGEADAPRGMGTLMGWCALDQAYFALGLDVVTAKVVAANTGSLGMHERLGFQPDCSSAHRSPSGIDTRFLVLRRSDWIALRDDLAARLFGSEAS